MPDQPKTNSLFIRMHKALSRTANALGRTMDAVAGRRLDDAFFEELEETLILADCGAPAAMAVVAELRQQSNTQREYRPEEVRAMLADIIAARLTLQPMPQYDGLFALLVVGVNGAGKTTTVGKLAYRLAQGGKKVIIAAADTFRAAAAEQLSVWAERANAQLIQHQAGSDPAAVVFDAISAARARNCDAVLCDTAGRLHNKKQLMEELAKVARIAGRESIPKLTLLVLDGVTGQNAIAQAEAFVDTVAVDGIVVTKLDGTARGGAVLAIAEQLKLPVWFVGVGEGIDDLQPFDAQAYARGMMGIG